MTETKISSCIHLNIFCSRLICKNNLSTDSITKVWIELVAICFTPTTIWNHIYLYLKYCDDPMPFKKLFTLLSYKLSKSSLQRLLRFRLDLKCSIRTRLSNNHYSGRVRLCHTNLIYSAYNMLREHSEMAPSPDKISSHLHLSKSPSKFTTRHQPSVSSSYLGNYCVKNKSALAVV